MIIPPEQQTFFQFKEDKEHGVWTWALIWFKGYVGHPIPEELIAEGRSEPMTPKQSERFRLTLEQLRSVGRHISEIA